MQALSTTNEAGGTGVDKSKRIRALQKKLRQIQQLKEKMKNEGGKILNIAQSVVLGSSFVVLALFWCV